MNGKTAPWLAGAAAAPAASTENSATAAETASAGTTPSPEGNNAPSADDGAPTVDSKAPEAAAPAADTTAEETVTVTVPKAFRLRLDPQTELQFKAGIQEMTRANAEHWYSKANGVVIYTKGTE